MSPSPGGRTLSVSEDSTLAQWANRFSPPSIPLDRVPFSASLPQSVKAPSVSQSTSVVLCPARMAGCIESPDASRSRSGSKISGITSAHDVATWRHRERTREAFHSAARADAKGAVNQALACVHALSALAGMCRELPGVFEEHGCVGCSCCIQRLPACGRTWFRVRRGSRL